MKPPPITPDESARLRLSYAADRARQARHGRLVLLLVPILLALLGVSGYLFGLHVA